MDRHAAGRRALPRRRAQEERSPPEATARTVATALLRALGSAQEAGIFHRDVKPANVMLTPRGDVLLTDFGIAVDHADTRLTPTNLVIGTPGYTAPERWQGVPPSGASDLYSLGVTLYEAVEGDLPSPRESGRRADRRAEAGPARGWSGPAAGGPPGAGSGGAAHGGEALAMLAAGPVPAWKGVTVALTRAEMVARFAGDYSLGAGLVGG
ncbi:protein kinase [Streptomyces diastatochromogenes]|nr:protein kinase [Streptomyces diastatochromogenes]